MVVKIISSEKEQLIALRTAQMIKSKEPLYKQLQIYLNNLIDKKVNQAYDTNLDQYNGYDSFSQANIFTTIFNLNSVDTVRSFQRIIDSPYTSNDAVFKNLTRISADNTTRVISEAETQRVLKNLDYVEKTLQTAKFDIDKYNQLAKNISTSRYDILEKSLEEGKMFTGRELSYKELDRLAENLERYKQHKVDYEEAKAINEEARANGLPDVYTHKQWIWSQLENTRHAGMDGMIVEFYDLFTVTNDVIGEVDSLLFPGDVENYHNPSNIINCQCPYEILKNEDAIQEIGEHNANVGKSDYKNSLSYEEMKHYDDTLGTKVPKESQKAHRLYSVDSNIVNDYLSLSNKEFLKKYSNDGWTIPKVEKQLTGLKKSQITTNEDTIVYKGFKTTSKIDVNRVNNKNGYISTSLDEAVAIGYTRSKGDYISIKIPKGTEVIYLRKYSEYPNHMEIMISPKYKIHEYKVNGKLMYEVRKR